MAAPMRCPTHKRPMINEKTRHGGRWKCPVATCSVVCWSNATSTPADEETRKLRHQCHSEFDRLWNEPGGYFRRHKRKGLTPRKAAYRWLDKEMGEQDGKAHFGVMTASECRRALVAIKKLQEAK